MKQIHLENKNFEVKAKLSKKTWMTLIICISVLVTLFLITNPRYFFFLSDSTIAKWEDFLDQSKFFGDFNNSTSVWNLSLVVIPQLITMIAIVLAALMATKIIFHMIKPKTKRFATVKTLILSSAKYIFAIIAIYFSIFSFIRLQKQKKFATLYL